MQCVAESDNRRVIGILAAQPEIMAILASVERLQVPDGWVGAGLIRNAVWDAVSGGGSPQPPSDVDVVYFDARNASRQRDAALQAALIEAHRGPRWSVKSQARMHERAGDAPYATTADAISRWPETCTAVAARLVHGQIEVLAPWGLADLLSLVVRPTAAFERNPDVFQARVRDKAWTTRWRGITIVAPPAA